MYRSDWSILIPSTGVAFIGGAEAMIGGVNIMMALLIAVGVLLCLGAVLLTYRRFALGRMDAVVRHAK